MRVLVGHNFYLESGGEDAVFKTEVAMLKKYGHEVYVYERSNKEIKKGLFLRIKQLFSLCWSKSSYDEIRSIIRTFKPSVAHFHNTFFMMTPSVFDACRDEGVPVVVSLHNFRLVCANGLFLREGKVCQLCHSKSQINGILSRCYRKSFFLSALVANMIRYHWKRLTWINKVDRFIVASEFTGKQFVNLGIPADKIMLKPHFVEGSVDSKAKIDGHYMLYAGRLSEEKGIEVLLRAWSELQDIPLYIVGSGPMRGYMDDFIAKGNYTNIHVLGFLDKKNYEEVFSNASALIVPSLCYENFPRVVVEAYSKGIAVIASKLGSLQEIVHEGQTGALFTCGNPEDLRRCVKYVWNENRYLELGQKAKIFFSEQFTEYLNYTKILNIYEHAINP
jgi:glycosyltransferase involved in cell wall biosynthesis